MHDVAGTAWAWQQSDRRCAWHRGGRRLALGGVPTAHKSRGGGPAAHISGGGGPLVLACPDEHRAVSGGAGTEQTNQRRAEEEPDCGALVELDPLVL
jgi:hypothetical protein